jgi:RNA polymerase sigma-70 factor (ECF subfamily)
MEDSDWLKKLQSLDPQTLAEVHDQYYALVYRYILIRTGDPKVGEDLTSEVFLALLEALHRHRIRTSNVQAWLMATAFHLVQDEYRRHYRRPQDALDDHEDHVSTEEDAEVQLDHHLRQEQVHAALLKLSADQQHVLTLRFALEQSVEETAHTLNKSVSAVKVIQFRAVQALRKLLEKSEKP